MAEEKPLERATCWIDKTLVRMAKEIAAREEMTLSEVLERELTKPISKRHDRIFHSAEIGEAGA